MATIINGYLASSPNSLTTQGEMLARLIHNEILNRQNGVVDGLKALCDESRTDRFRRLATAEPDHRATQPIRNRGFLNKIPHKVKNIFLIILMPELRQRKIHQRIAVFVA